MVRYALRVYALLRLWFPVAASTRLASQRVDAFGSRPTKLLFTFDANRIWRGALSRVREDCTRLGNYFVTWE